MVKHGEECGVRRGLSSAIHVISFGLVCLLSEARTAAQQLQSGKGLKQKGVLGKFSPVNWVPYTSIIITIQLKGPHNKKRLILR